MEEEEGVGERKRKMRRSGRRNGESIIMQREREREVSICGIERKGIEVLAE